MSKSVWKYGLRLEDSVTAITVPGKYRFMRAHVFDDDPTTVYIWLEIEPREPERKVSFVLMATGEEASGRAKIHETVVHHRTGLVWHVVELFPEEDE